jgi:glutaredoxin-like YruB-family protein
MQVIVYSTPTCPWCKKTKEFLEESNVKFSDIDVSSNQEKAAEMIAKSGQMGVPVTSITKDDGSEEIIIGYDEKAFKKELGI